MSRRARLARVLVPAPRRGPPRPLLLPRSDRHRQVRSVKTSSCRIN